MKLTEENERALKKLIREKIAKAETNSKERFDLEYRWGVLADKIDGFDDGEGPRGGEVFK